MATLTRTDSAFSGKGSTFNQHMHRYPFIFSDERNIRIKRHLAFWGFWWMFQSLLYSFSALSLQIPYFRRLPLSAIESLFYLIPHMFLAYSLMYWTIPKFLLKGRYPAAAVAIALQFLATAILSTLIGMYVLHYVRVQILGVLYVPPPHIHETQLFLSLLAGLRGGITIGGMAAAIKLLKFWYTKEQRNLQLQKENAETQLQLLKAQVHPHFLFNTLNNIYAYTQHTSPVASKLVMGLSDMLRYMLYECNRPMVPLQHELKMLQDYITLEQIRYEQNLDINLNLPSDTDNLMIAPLLLLPFVENCFKHGTSHMLEQPWVSLTISIEDRQFRMKLLNGKAPDYTPAQAAAGIGIRNVQQRLSLLYPGKHQLKISNEADVFIVNLKIDLIRQSEPVKSSARQMALYE